MSTIQEFENAPVGATTTSPRGSIAFKTARLNFEWSVYDSNGYYINSLSSDEMGGFTLNPVAPTTAREALDLAWELAHEVKAGQVIPAGTRYLELHNFELRETSLPNDLRVSHGLVSKVRTHEPLPGTEPEWTKAPAVLAAMDDCSWQKVWFPSTPGYWECTCCGVERHWSKMSDVTPLYPEGEKND